MKKYRFYKEWDYTDNNPNYNWFIDFKYFPFNKRHLVMVAGADLLLDKLSDGKDEATLMIDTSPIPYSDGWLTKGFASLTTGAIYKCNGIEINGTHGNNLYLCPATLWAFLKYPNKIYYKVDHTKLDNSEEQEGLLIERLMSWVYGQPKGLSFS